MAYTPEQKPIPRDMIEKLLPQVQQLRKSLAQDVGSLEYLWTVINKGVHLEDIEPVLRLRDVVMKLCQIEDLLCRTPPKVQESIGSKVFAKGYVAPLISSHVRQSACVDCGTVWTHDADPTIDYRCPNCNAKRSKRKVDKPIEAQDVDKSLKEQQDRIFREIFT